MANEGAALWRALKGLTEDGSDARRVVNGVHDEDGFRAWSKLNSTYGLQLSAKQGIIRSQFYALIGRRKTPSETRSHLIEIDRMAKSVYEITGEELRDVEIKSVIVGALDPRTCEHTSHLHGDKYSLKELRASVSSIINNTVRDADAMQIGSLEAGDSKSEEDYGENADAELNALKGNGQRKMLQLRRHRTYCSELSFSTTGKGRRQRCRRKGRKRRQ